MNYDADLKIDIDQLDVEWIKQPRRYMIYADALAKAEAALRDAKARMNLVRARTILRIVGSAEKKPTESVLDAMVVTDDAYKIELAQVSRLEYEVDVLKAAVKAFEQRKTALENEVKLWQGGYFAGPREPRQLDNMSINDLADERAAAQQRQGLKK